MNYSFHNAIQIVFGKISTRVNPAIAIAASGKEPWKFGLNT